MLNILHYQPGLCKPMSRTVQYGTQTTVNKLACNALKMILFWNNTDFVTALGGCDQRILKEGNRAFKKARSTQKINNNPRMKEQN